MTDYEELLKQAHEAGMKAGQECLPTPMIVGEAKSLFGSEIDYSKPTYYVEDGVCGFAWVQYKGNTPFGRWMKKTGRAKKGYPTGYYIWVTEFNQSMQRKEAYARAYAKVLNEAGIKDAYAYSRMD